MIEENLKKGILPNNGKEQQHAITSMSATHQKQASGGGSLS